MTEAQKVTLETNYILVESEYFKDTLYAIDRNGKGMWIYSGGQMIPLAAEHVETFLHEALDTWRVMKGAAA